MLFQLLGCGLLYPKDSGLPQWLSSKEYVCQYRSHVFDPWVKKIPWRRKWQPISVFSPGKFHGQRSLVGYSPWGHKELDMTEHTHACKGTKILPAAEHGQKNPQLKFEMDRFNNKFNTATRKNW